MKTINKNENTEILVMDEPGEGNACHEYEVRPLSYSNEEEGIGYGEGSDFAKVSFQNGPIKENSVNGCQQEDLLAIVEHRLECFQEGDFACIENQIALDHVKSAIGILNQRTKSRVKRGVEGTNQK